MATGWPERLTIVIGWALLPAMVKLVPLETVDPFANVAVPKVSSGICLLDEKLGSSSIHSAEE